MPGLLAGSCVSGSGRWAVRRAKAVRAPASAVLAIDSAVAWSNSSCYNRSWRDACRARQARDWQVVG